MNLEKRIEQLERAMEAATQETVIHVRIIVVETREALAALKALREAEPPAERPQPRGKIKIELLPSVSAAEYLAQRGIILQPEQEQSA